MADSIIGIKELHRNLKRVADAAVKGKSFTVVRDSKPVFKIEPIGVSGTKSKRTGTLDDFLERASFHSNDPLLSQHIDEVVYGDNR
ncbi:hypothetical protein COU18_02615 [Candidatus Kaiserbacteria bacterium CG10_big_fil_rev_8_21_14_0_10_51_14]|uniref:Antitoxin n=1 Tax=Candidatus Kaiserbacteria bacterium CG10_big_fil_rev_8_21_14_0_10_51_14 TaxID=1974610 RepID=A0A2H0UAV4_9BACT|nr:MAG: hypothetical protein COU18_02615 [Candidatus Kaiserbacteria bacterium CG10_big_fil_rev_8_21_14_0_10_51_14]